MKKRTSKLFALLMSAVMAISCISMPDKVNAATEMSQNALTLSDESVYEGNGFSAAFTRLRQHK